ncbi:hypothetical protein HDU97_008590 [Phlyctochytrium planicorne]|nr:hypothetical protein HDU97_008590 [Phlyctochytrium planicorne]
MDISTYVSRYISASTPAKRQAIFKRLRSRTKAFPDVGRKRKRHGPVFVECEEGDVGRDAKGEMLGLYWEDGVGAVGMIDIIGFTMLTCELAKSGRISSEFITKSVADFMKGIMDVVCKYDGDVIKGWEE